MSKQFLYGDEARRALERGVEKVVSAVKLTLGPRGRNVILDKKYVSPLVTNDGVTIAKEISLPCPFENIGASLVKEASIKTNDLAGDGTTTATILAGEIVKEGQKNISFGASPILISQGIRRATKEVIDFIKKMSRPVEDTLSIKNVATISAGDEEIGKIIASAFEKVGRDGTVSLGDSTTAETYLEVVEGLSFDKGYMSPYMATNPEKMISELSEPFILVTDRKISSITELLPLLEEVAKSGKPLLIIAEDIDKDALAALVLNKLRGTLLINAVKAPLFGERRKEALEDIAVLTGATYVSSDIYNDFSSLGLENLGRAQSVKISKDSTSIVGGRGQGETLSSHKEKIRVLLKAATDDYDKTRLEQRLAKLSSGIAIIKVGGVTEAEANERKLRIEDALSAVKASFKNGIVCGGGTAYLRAKMNLNKLSLNLEGEQKIGAQIIEKSLEAPFRQIALNSQKDPGSLLKTIYESSDENFGYDALNDEFVNLLEKGIIDPAEVEIRALENASSVAISILSTECLVADNESKENQEQ